MLAIEGAIVTIDAMGCLQERHDWPGLQSAVVVESTREIDDKTEREIRFSMTSLAWLAHQIGPVIRSHRAVENSLHWGMDMIFRDDERRLRTDHAPANFTALKHMAHNRIRRASGKDSMRPKAQSRRLGRRLPRQPHSHLNRSPDSPARFSTNTSHNALIRRTASS